MPVTIRDVAKRLHLSITTVSRALDGYDDVASETQKEVIRTAHEMGYIPNRAARQLRRRKAETIGFIMPASAKRIAEPFFMEFIAGLGDELTMRGYDFLVANATTHVDERELYQRWVGGNKVDGLIVTRLNVQDWRVQYLIEQNVPFATLERSNGRAIYPCVQVDGEHAYFELLRHLVDNGYHHIAFIGGPVELVNHQNRLGWIRKAAGELDLLIDPAFIISADLTSMGGYQAAKELLDITPRPDAILCIDDETAFGALHAAHEKGLSIGSEIGIVGFDGTLESQHTEPPLTTLDIPLYNMACRLVRMLLKTLAGHTQEADVDKIIPELHIRGSTHRS
ncbi:MAG: LacI family DNA-binding transcriptional regulator [Anaerolineaceae bacterium]|nr:LacI family DNA-binding transcriptional regulator [Anaerolineaceae bacterium]